jgi:hypothetical protein
MAVELGSDEQDMYRERAERINEFAGRAVVFYREKRLVEHFTARKLVMKQFYTCPINNPQSGSFNSIPSTSQQQHVHEDLQYS